jgi:SAM-dependent methyltransferase
MATTPAPETPQTWHQGLVAKWWSEFKHDGPEIAYFQGFIQDGGEPALDLGCGTGRLLLPYLRAGLDVDGCDVSADMLALCSEQAAREGLSPTLYEQAMHELDLPRANKRSPLEPAHVFQGRAAADVGTRRVRRHRRTRRVLGGSGDAGS